MYPADPVLLFDEAGRMFVLQDSALADDLIETEDELHEGYDGHGRPLTACGDPGKVHLAVVTEEPQEDELRGRVNRYYAVFASRHPTRIPPQEDDLVTFIRAVSEDWIEE
ncbi:hypothetical protein J8N05_14095 [Streptomyces sp. BH-SS-21]|uniref:Uncharacterized protein n=1 Tax=Streptomyces liliiviolaceus TaxID=2823109 RepID=A0A940XYA5_9ACTN|nr:hypothetical protein [Streptomyces liliiviolaceus]MBQ0849336.1 hypothetical protein [Streptomyces liliiviolaceus]